MTLVWADIASIIEIFYLRGDIMIKKILIILYLIATFLFCAHLDAEVTFAQPFCEEVSAIY